MNLETNKKTIELEIALNKTLNSKPYNIEQLTKSKGDCSITKTTPLGEANSRINQLQTELKYEKELRYSYADENKLLKGQIAAYKGILQELINMLKSRL